MASIITGIRDKDVQNRLLKDDVELKKVIFYCKEVETADKNV